MITESPSEEYVLVPKVKHRLTRARKFIIGFMAIGSVAAITGAGTFASFSASTTNDATFQTAKLALKNTTNATGAAACYSDSGSNHAQEGTGTQLDINDQTCDTLFSTALVPGQTYTAGVELSNAGNADGTLKVFATSVCGEQTAGSPSGSATDLCSKVQVTIAPTTAVSNWTADTSNCAYPSGSTDCDPASSTSSNYGTLEDLGTNHKFTDTGSGNGPISLVTLDKSGGTAPTKRYIVSVYMPHTTSGANPNLNGNTCQSNGFDDKGIGCDNVYMNRKAVVSLRWLLQQS